MIDIVMPKWGLTMEGGVVSAHLKEPGASVTEGEAICEVETDKVTSEIVAPASGILGEWLAREGEEVRSGAVIGRIQTDEEPRDA